MDTILVPTDFSETAKLALEVAVQLTKKHNSKLILLHMLEIPEHLLPEADKTNDVTSAQTTHQHDLPAALFYMKLAQKRFGEIAELPFMQGIRYEETVQNHLDFKAIIDSAHKNKADLIIMGSHGATGFKEMFVGSNTEKVVRTSDIPVLVIKAKSENFTIKNFVFATNWEEESKQSLIDAYNLAKKLGAKMNILYVNTPGSTFLTTAAIDTKFEALLKENMIAPETVTTSIYSDKSIEEGILNFSKKINADLIGVTTHGRRGIAHFFNNSISEDIANHANIPVVTFKIE
ncbi:universal stress protein [Aequorivita marina]|uniref:universal stress protein n=1 Tax=Aequorivita marina TaxID=3073654 RepID=UPI002873F7BE|nr:universal stress protein [Aequorivita sp. S2608]MDS1299278.1 universal stress protein [Aequorivita sp. S2608]